MVFAFTLSLIHISLFEILAHDYQCLIDVTVAVGVIFTHGITYDTGTFTVGAVVTDPQIGRAHV